MNPRYMIYHDLIGYSALAQHQSKKNKNEFKDIGIIIDDTANMLIAEKNQKVKKYIKKEYTFSFQIPDSDESLEVKGEKIVGRPENRLRNLKKKRWFK